MADTVPSELDADEPADPVRRLAERLADKYRGRITAARVIPAREGR